MNERIRITHPSRGRPRVRRTVITTEIDEQTGLGDVYVRSLIRSQLRLGIGVAAISLGVLALLPLLFHLVPVTNDIAVLGITLPWLILGAVVYPALLAAAVFYVYGAERVERDFVNLLDDR